MQEYHLYICLRCGNVTPVQECRDDPECSFCHFTMMHLRDTIPLPESLLQGTYWSTIRRVIKKNINRNAKVFSVFIINRNAQKFKYIIFIRENHEDYRRKKPCTKQSFQLFMFYSLVQSSTANPSILKNSLVLLVTTVSPSDFA